MRYRLLSYRCSWVVLVALLLTWGCSRDRMDPDALAKVDHEQIRRDEFIRSILLMPRYDPRRKGVSAIRQHLNSLVENKLLARYARQQGLDRDPRIQKRMKWIEQNAMVEQLFREVVQKKVQVTEAELREAFVKYNTRIRARHLFARTEQEAYDLYERLQNGADWDSLARQLFRDATLAENGGDLGWFKFGEMDPDFEAACYALPPGQISEPVRTRFGWHIIRVEDKQVNPILTEHDFAQNYKKLERIVRSRKENALANRYVKELMEPLNVRVRGKAFAFLLEKARIYFGEPTRQGKLPPQPIRDQQVVSFSQLMEPFRDEVLVEFRGGHWTIGDFLDRLEAMPPAERPRLNSAGGLQRGIKWMIRDEFLAREARKMGLQHHPYVRSEVALWFEDTMAQLVKARIADTISVTEAEIQSYYQSHPEKYGVQDRVSIREILVPDSLLAAQLLARAQRGEDFSRLARQYTRRTWARDRGGEFPYFVRGSYGIIGELAFQHGVGEWVGPVRTAEGFSIFQVIGRKEGFLPPMSEDAKLQVENELRRQKFEAVYQPLIEGLRSRSHIVFADSTFRRVAEELGGEDFAFMVVRKIKQ
ncbi:MAG: peptidylprolyl isomerase [candidate division KSB1 bacterium]|nr:peptidylprolyl isomerase [candidate division KSB1 bacterium]